MFGIKNERMEKNPAYHIFVVNLVMLNGAILLHLWVVFTGIVITQAITLTKRSSVIR